MKPLFKFAKYMGQYLSLNKAKSQQFSRNRFKVFFFFKKMLIRLINFEITTKNISL